VNEDLSADIESLKTKI